jgi:hypothetical protein
MREGTTSRVMAADRPYGEFYDFYSVSTEYFGYHHVIQALAILQTIRFYQKSYYYYINFIILIIYNIS